MNKKNTYILFIVLIVLIFGIVAKNYFSDRNQKAMIAGQKLLTADVADSIDKIEIKKGQTETILEKKADAWFVSSAQNYPANSNLAQTLISSLKNGTLSSIADNTLDQLAAYQLDEASRTTLNVKKEGITVGNFWVGRSGDSYGTYYVVKESINKVYLAQNINSNFAETEWRDRTILQTNKDEVASVKITLPKETFELAKTDNKWQIAKRDVKQAAIDALLNQLTLISANSFPPAGFGFVDSGTKLEIKLANDTKTLILGQTLENGQVAIKNNDGLIYIITKDIADILTKNQKSYF